MNITFKKSLFLAVTILLISGIFISAQTESGKSVDEKIKSIKGNVSKITIETDDGVVKFEGSQAEKIFKRLKKYSKFAYKPKSKSNVYFFDNDSSDVEEYRVKVIELGDEDESIFFSDNAEGIWYMKFDDDSLKEKQKKIKVEIKDGEKTVTVTTNKDGDEEVKTYSGEDADEYLEKHGMKKEKIIMGKKLKHKMIRKMHKCGDDDVSVKDIYIELDDSSGAVSMISSGSNNKKIKVVTDSDDFFDDAEGNEILIELTEGDTSVVKLKKLLGGNATKVLEWIDEDDDSGNMTKIKYTTEDGIKKLVLTEIEDGEETTKVYKGKEAEEKFNELKKEHGIHFNPGKGKTIKKIIID